MMTLLTISIILVIVLVVFLAGVNVGACVGMNYAIKRQLGDLSDGKVDTCFTCGTPITYDHKYHAKERLNKIYGKIGQKGKK